MNKKSTKLILGSILIGIVLGQFGIFGIAIICVFLLVILGVSLIMIIVGVLKSDKNVLSSSVLIVGLAIVTLIITLSTVFMKYQIRVYRNEKIISELFEYKKANKEFPSSLSEIGYGNVDLDYEVYPEDKKFILRASFASGIIHKHYDSEKRNWIYID